MWKDWSLVWTVLLATGCPQSHIFLQGLCGGLGVALGQGEAPILLVTGLIGQEVEDAAQGAWEAVLEAAAQADIEQRVEAAVEIRQAEGQHFGQPQMGQVGRVLRLHQHQDVNDVKGQPAEHEAEHHGADDATSPLGAGHAPPAGAACCLVIHHPVAQGNDEDGEQEPQAETQRDDDPGHLRAVAGSAYHLVAMAMLCREDKVGRAAD